MRVFFFSCAQLSGIYRDHRVVVDVESYPGLVYDQLS